MSAKHPAFSRRERQVMDILYAKHRATAAQVMESLADPSGYSAVRTLLATLESKGFVRHERDGAKYVFVPKMHPEKAGQSALSHLIQTFFKGSRGRAAAALLDGAPSQFSPEELYELEELIRKARKTGKGGKR